MNNTQVVVLKTHKSTGLAVLLTVLFGPFGLFYASITGGIIMVLTPIVVLATLVGGMYKGDPYVIFGSLLFIVIFFLFNWVICVIWSIIGVSSYNARLDKEIMMSRIQHAHRT